MQNYNNILQYIEETIKKNCGENSSFIKNATFASYGLSSLQLVNFLIELKRNINIEFDIVEAMSLSTPEELAKLICAIPYKKELNNTYKQNENKSRIAIIGMSCRFPGLESENGLDSFWETLRTGYNPIRNIPEERWNSSEEYKKGHSIFGGFIKNIDCFDAPFFHISPREALSMDPQQRIALELCYHALEHACLPKNKLEKLVTGVFWGVSDSEYGKMILDSEEYQDLYAFTGNSGALLPGRISYYFDLHGPCVGIDTASSGGLHAVHHAVRSLRSGECELAIVGSVNLLLTPEKHRIMSRAGVMAADGKCKTFDAAADGYVRSEGGGVLILARMETALQNDSRIFGVIRGSAVTHDGHSNGLTTPNPDAQSLTLRMALEDANLSPSDLDYIECHGTGTYVGDPIEVKGIASVFQGRSKENPLKLGSVKSNIGHLEQAAGLAGIIKLLLAFKYEIFPANLHFKNKNPLLDLSSIPAIVVSKEQIWKRSERPRIAGVSGFSLSGANAHIILEEPELKSINKEYKKLEWQILPFSAKTSNTLYTQKEVLLSFLKKNDKKQQNENILSEICHTAQEGRNHFEFRSFVVGNNIQDMINELNEQNNFLDNIIENRGVAFLFTGQGSQYSGMGKDLIGHPIFKNALDECAKYMDEKLDVPVKQLLFEERFAYLLRQTAYSQPALFAFEYALAQLWIAWGIVPSVLIGHSLGEYVAACLAGVFSVQDACKLVIARGHFMQQTLPGKMLAVFASKEYIYKILNQYSDKINTAAINGPEHIVLSGKEDNLIEIENELRKEKIHSKYLDVEQAFHSYMMESILDKFMEVASSIKYSEPSIPIISNVTGKILEKNELTTPEYWRSHIRNTVLFADGIESLKKTNCSHMLEIGPAPVLCNMGRRVFSSNVRWIPSFSSDKSEWKSVLHALGLFYSDGFNPTWNAVSLCIGNCYIDIPNYSFEQHHYWITRINEGEKTNINNEKYNQYQKEDKDKFIEIIKDKKEIYLEKEIRKVLRLPEEAPLPYDRPLASFGTDSLMAMELLTQIQKDWGVHLQLKDIMNNGGIHQIAAFLPDSEDISSTGQIKDFCSGMVDFPTIKHDTDNRYLPFPLTSVQHAYWIGRNGGLELSDVSCFLYIEAEIACLDIKRFELSINKLIERHDALRTIINKNGQQQVLSETPFYSIPFTKIHESDENKEYLESLRNTLSHQNRDASIWPLFDVRITQIDDVYRIHIGIDLLISDAWSFGILLRDLVYEYAGYLNLLHTPEIKFRDYVLAQQKFFDSDIYKSAEQYWKKQVEDLPPGPDLPLLSNRTSSSPTRFKRYTGSLDAMQWEKLQRYAQLFGITPSGVLLAAFSIVLARWSQSSRFSLMLTLFNRLPVHEDINEVVGDFTSLLLLCVSVEDNPFFVHAATIQQQLWQDMEYRYECAVDVLRMLKQKNGGSNESYAPVVFTSMLPLTAKSGNISNALEIIKDVAGEINITHCITQTPQVRFDHQVYEQNGELHFNWDIAQGTFPDGMIEDMFLSYSNLLVQLVEKENTWKSSVSISLPERQIQIRNQANSTRKKLPESTLHAGFLKVAQSFPERTAVYILGETKSYGEIASLASGVADWLLKNGARSGDVVGVVSDGWRKIPAILGILMIGGIYLPLAPDAPKQRSAETLTRAEARYLLGDQAVLAEFSESIWNFLPLEQIEAKEIFHGKEVSSEDPAYVIYTSGSTGKPKGVLISHGAACNTIFDINIRNNVSEVDRILGISRLNFDLSVYDIFGAFHAGAAVVVPNSEDRTDPAHWLKLMQEAQVSIWNSVPALMSMLLDYTELARVNVPKQLRLVLLSGDWIPLDLPKRLWAKLPSVHIVGMGGATEASIWSNAYDIKEISPQWTSIPYGYPLANQGFHVLNAHLEHCPEWVPGDLYITGRGLALGYFKDPDLTAASFILHPVTGERMYRTGDRGRYWPDGSLEFLGRQDNQVKIRGHRIELGEIEHALQDMPSVKQAVAKVTNAGQSITAYVTLNKDINSYEIIKQNLPIDLYLTRQNMIASLIVCSDNDNSDFPISCASKYLNDINIVSLNFMTQVLKDMGALHYLENGISIQELIVKCSVAQERVFIFKVWIKNLEQANIIILRSGKYWINKEINLKNNNEKLSNNWGVCLENITNYLARLRKYGVSLFRGEINPLEVFFNDKDMLSPEVLISLFPGYKYRLELTSKVIHTFYEYNKDKINILEIGGRTGVTAQTILNMIYDIPYFYTLTDNSTYLLEKQRSRLNIDIENIKIVNFDPLQPLYLQPIEPHSQDIIIAPSYIHRTHDVRYTVKKLKELLKAGGILILLEETANTILQNCTVAFLENGFSHFEDERQEKGLPLLNSAEWASVLRDAGFSVVYDIVGSRHFIGQTCTVGFVENEISILDIQKVLNHLHQLLPEYMVPQHIIQLDEFPLTVNGKIDKKALVEPSEQITTQQEKIIPSTDEEKVIAALWHELLPSVDISITDNFFTVGGDSLLGVKLIAGIRNSFKIDIPLRWIFEYPTIAMLSSAVKQASEQKDSIQSLLVRPQLVSDRTKLYEPFPLTDVQYAYWVGKMGIFSLGNVSTHCYFEIEEEGLDIERLISCWQQLIEQHDMMRAVVSHDGQSQYILEKVPQFIPKIIHFAPEIPQDDVDKALIDIRNRLSHQIIPSDSWPLFNFEITCYGNNYVRLHIGFENIIFDGWSMLHLLSELTRLYNKKEKEDLRPFEISFRDYVLMLQTRKNDDVYNQAKKYWIKRIPTLPDAPKLPIRNVSLEQISGEFYRYQFTLDAPTWRAFQEIVRQNGLSPAGVLLTAYADILSLWSRDKHFTLNLTLFDRLQVHPDVNRLVGDFTSLTLLEVDTSEGQTFFERARKLQQRLWEDRDHAAFNGVEVLREMTALSGGINRKTMPVVFTSALGVGGSGPDNGLNMPGKFIYGISQTPQVWLDHQVYENEGELLLVWDAVEDLFPAGLIGKMFETYKTLLNFIAYGTPPDNVLDLLSSDAQIGINKQIRFSSNIEESLRRKFEFLLDNTSLYSIELRKQNGELCPDWVDGEIYIYKIGGEAVPTGIWARRTPEGILESSCYGTENREIIDSKENIDSNKRKDDTYASEIAQELLILWKSVLNKNDLTYTDNFFAAGGDSFIAARLMGTIRGHFHCEVALKLLFDHPTIYEFAPYLESIINDETEFDGGVI